MASQPTLLDLRTATRDVLDEQTPGRWQNGQLNRYVNQGQSRTWNEVRRLREDFFASTITSLDGVLTILGEPYNASNLQVTVGGTTMTLPPDFAELTLIEVITANFETVRFTFKKLNSPYFRAARELTTNTSPNGFFFDIQGRTKLVYSPRSDTPLDTRLTYIYRLPKLVSDTDPMPLPEPLDIAVAWFAAASAQLQDFAPEAAANETRARKIIEETFASDSNQDQEPLVANSAWASYVDW